MNEFVEQYLNENREYFTETVFAYPGMGQLLIQAVNLRNMSVVQAAVFMIALFFHL